MNYKFTAFTQITPFSSALLADMLIRERAYGCFTRPAFLHCVFILCVHSTSLTRIQTFPIRFLQLSLLLYETLQGALSTGVCAVCYSDHSESLWVPDTVFFHSTNRGGQPGCIISILMPSAHQVHTLRVNPLHFTHSDTQLKHNSVTRSTAARVTHGFVNVSTTVNSRAQSSPTRRPES